MINWIEGRLGRAHYAFSEFPILKWRAVFFIFLILLATVVYQPLIAFLYKFNMIGMHVFQVFIQQNVKLLIWGQIVIPLVIAIWGYLDVVSLYEQKHLKRYKCLPKWIN